MQLIAMLTMLIDHVGLIFFPDEPIWRIVGRIAFPIYAYAVVLGYQRTRSLKDYLIRLVIIAALSQLPYMWAFHTTEINVVAALFVCLCVLWALDKLPGKWMSFLIFASAMALLESFAFDYGSYALLLILIYRYFLSYWVLLLHVVLNLVFWVYKGWDIQLYSILPTIALVYLPNVFQTVEVVRIPNWLWRSFYPAHLLILAILSADLYKD